MLGRRLAIMCYEDRRLSLPRKLRNLRRSERRQLAAMCHKPGDIILKSIQPFFRRALICFGTLVSGIFCIVGPTISLAEEAAPAKPSIESQFLSNIRQVASGFVKAGEGY